MDTTKFRHRIEDRLAQTQNEHTDSEATWRTLKDAMTQTATECALPRSNMKDLITPETAKVILERRELKERGIITTEDHELYAKLNRDPKNVPQG